MRSGVGLAALGTAEALEAIAVLSEASGFDPAMAPILQEASTVRENDSLLRTAQYTAGTDEICVKNTGENGPDPGQTAQNTHNGRLMRSTSPHRRITARRGLIEVGSSRHQSSSECYRQVSRNSLAIWDRRSFVV